MSQFKVVCVFLKLASVPLKNKIIKIAIKPPNSFDQQETDFIHFHLDQKKML